MNARTRRLDEVCTITMGQAPPGDSYNTDGEGLPLIAGAGDFDGQRPLAKKFTTAPSKVCAPGDIVLGIRASIGAKVLPAGEYCLGRGVAGLRPGHDLDRQFLWHWLAVSTPALAAKGRGATFLQVNREDIGAMQIPLPPIDEQRRIAAILDQTDALRANRRQALAHLDAFQHSIFLDMFPVESCTLVNAGVLMPSMRNGLSPATAGTYPAEVLTLSAVTRGQFDPTAVKPARFAVIPPPDKRVSELDFLICRGNGNKALVGVGAFSGQDRFDLVFPDTVIAGRVDPSRITMPYLNAAWEQQGVRHQIEALAHTTNGTYKVNQQTLSSVMVPLPPLHRQHEFEVRIERVNAQRAIVQRAAAGEDELLACIQSRAFNGKL